MEMEQAIYIIKTLYVRIVRDGVLFMSEEEREAIEVLKGLLKYKYKDIYVLECDFYAVETVLNLIEKQQKEIEQYKELDKKICNEELLNKNYVLENYISKNILKAKIKELEEKDKYSNNNVYGYGIYFLKELLGDDNK